MKTEAQVHGKAHTNRRRCFLLDLLLRVLVLLISITVIAVMVNAKESRRLGPVVLKAKWKSSKAFVGLVVVSAICLGYSLLQILLSFVFRASNPTSWAWAAFILDQLLTYALLALASAAAQVAYFAKNGSSAAQWREICSSFDTFCTRAGAAIILSFIAVLALAFTSAISAYRLFKRA